MYWLLPNIISRYKVLEISIPVVSIILKEEIDLVHTCLNYWDGGTICHQNIWKGTLGQSEVYNCEYYVTEQYIELTIAVASSDLQNIR